MLEDDLKKLYKSAMDNEKPSEEALLRLRKAMNKGVQHPAKTMYGFRRLLPLAAGFILLAVLTVPLMSYIGRSTPKEKMSTGALAPFVYSPAIIIDGSQTPLAAPIPSVATGNGNSSLTNGSETIETGESVSTQASYEELFNVINELRSKSTAGSRTYATSDASTGKAAVSAPVSAQASASPNYSDTNIQVSGVQESDVVKTDGQYIYAYSSDKLNIIKAVNGSFTKMSELPRAQKTEDGKQSGNAFEMYVEGNRLTVLRNTYTYRTLTQAPAVSDAKGYSIPYYSKSFVAADIYDISDKSNPKLLNSFSQDGNYISSRMIDGVIYLISNSYINGEIIANDPATFVPQIYKNGEPCLVAASDITVSIDPKKTSGSAQYLLLSGIDTSGSGKMVSNKSVLGYGNQIYSSKTSLYVTAYSSFMENGTAYGETKLYRFSLDNGNITLKAQGSVPGSILNQFSMDEYKDVFRIVTTVNSYTYVTAPSATVKSSVGVSQSSQYNCLYTLDSNLFIIGKIEKLASNERVYSVRFDGDIGYFVTFRQVDPLFAVDLSIPSNPRVLSALKIPGFSQYLHPYSDTLLFGLGRDADEQSGKAGFLKLSMFDVSDPKNVSEKSKLIIDGVYYSEASNNHKAILVDAAKNIIAFPADGKYLIYSYSPAGGFKQEATLQSFSGSKYSYNTRGLYIGDYFYIVSSGGISSYSMQTYKGVNEIMF